MASKKMKYWWIKQYYDYYNTEEIKQISKMEHGNDFIVLYQRMCLMGLMKQSDVLRIQTGQVNEPYTASDFAKEFWLDQILVEKGLYVLERYDLIKHLPDGSWYLPRLMNMVGKDSDRTQQRKKLDANTAKKREQTRLRVKKYRDKKRIEATMQKHLLTGGPKPDK